LAEQVESSLDHAFFQLERRNAVHQQADWQLLSLNDRHLKAFLGQLICATHARWPGANAGDAKPVGRGPEDAAIRVSESVFGQEHFNGTDCHGGGVRIKNTGPFTKTLADKCVRKSPACCSLVQGF